jgi:hypothetical protein
MNDENENAPAPETSILRRSTRIKELDIHLSQIMNIWAVIELYCSFDYKYLLVNIDLKSEFKNNKRSVHAKNDEKNERSRREEKNEKGAELSALVQNNIKQWLKMDFGWMNKVGLTIHVKQDKLDHSGVQGVVRRVEATGEGIFVWTKHQRTKKYIKTVLTIPFFW